MKTTSHELFEIAKHYIPGGVNSPVRAFAAVGGEPIFIEHADGAYVFDVEGRPYIDYVGAYGPMILGHAHPAVIEEIQQATDRGLGFGAPTRLEMLLAKRICELMPAVEQVRMVNSGTEATMSAVRLARAYTGRDKIIKFEGCYHGHADALLVKAGSGALTLGEPSSPGVPTALAQLTLTLTYNDLNQVREILAQVGHEVACIIVEPVAGNMSCVLPVADFLPGLRALCDQYGILLIFDEIMTGFRVALGGAQARYGVKPDLTTLGKIIGGGLPVGAFGGRREIMEWLAPLGPVYQAGTLSGNPITMTAGLKTLELIARPDFYKALEDKTTRLITGMLNEAQQAGIAMTANHIGGMFGLFFTTATTIETFADVMACDVTRFTRFFHGMLERGVYLAPSAFEAGFVSSAHDEESIETTLKAAREVFAHF